MATMIKIATLDDLDSLAGLFDQYRVFYQKPSDLDGAKQFLSARITQQESVVFIAYDQEQACGFVQLYPIFSSTRMRRLWLLNDLFVHPDYRGQGIGVQLIARSKILCRDTDACGLLLETAKSNTIGNQLYPKTGFELDADHHYYSWDNI